MEVAIATYNNPQWVQPLDEEFLFQQSYNHIYQQGHINLGQWISRKKDELKDLLTITNTVSSEWDGLTSRFLKPISSFGDQHYQLPQRLTTNKYSESKPFFKRISFNGNFSELLLKYEEPLHYMAQFITDDQLLAFIYNNFGFKGNNTELTFLELSVGRKKKGLFRSFFHLFLTKHQIDRNHLNRILILNFSSFRSKKIQKMMKEIKDVEEFHAKMEENPTNIAVLDKETFNRKRDKAGIESFGD